MSKRPTSGRVPMGLAISKELRDEAQRIANATGLTLNEVLRQALAAGMPVVRERMAAFEAAR